LSNLFDLFESKKNYFTTTAIKLKKNTTKLV